MPDQPYTDADVEALAAVLRDTFLERSLDCWPDFEREARAALKHLAARFVAEGRRQATEGWERRWNVDEPGETDLLWGEAGTPNETSARTALKQSRPGARVVSRLVGPWEAAEQAQPPTWPYGSGPGGYHMPGDHQPRAQAESPDSPAAKMRSLRAHPHGSACICDDCTARDEAEAHLAAMEERHQHEAEQDGDSR